MFSDLVKSYLLVAVALVGSDKQYMGWVRDPCLLYVNQDLVRSTAGEYLVVSIVGETKCLFCGQIREFPHGTLKGGGGGSGGELIKLENITVEQDGETIKCGLKLFEANRAGNTKYNEFVITAKHVVFDIDKQTTCDVVQIIFTRPGSNIKGDENVDKRIKSKITDKTRCDKIETNNAGSKYSVALTFEETGNIKEVLDAIQDKTVVIDGADHSFTACTRKTEIDDKKEQPSSASTETIAEFTATTDTSTEATTTSTAGSTITATTSTTTDKGSTTKETTTPSTSYDILISIGMTIIIVSLSILVSFSIVIVSLTIKIMLTIFNTFNDGFTRMPHQESVDSPTDNHNHAAQDNKEDWIISKESITDLWSDLTETPEDIEKNEEAAEMITVLTNDPSTSTVNNSDKKIKKPPSVAIQMDPEPDQRSPLLPKKPAAAYQRSSSVPVISTN